MSKPMAVPISGFRIFQKALTILGSVLIVCMIITSSARAFNIDTGNPDLTIRWDNTAKYSAAWRVGSASNELISSPNQDDGDRAFSRGLISNRFDLLSEMDILYKGWGARVSASAWYDDVYNKSNGNDSPGTVNAFSVPSNAFTKNTRDLHGRDAEILDAFVFGKHDFSNNSMTFRAGQYAMQWGESLFFGNNGIAGGMAPIDAVKLLSVPNTQFKELIRPVPQVSGQIQFGPRFSVGVYYQLAWEKSRLPAIDSYFGNIDIVGTGGERLFTGPPLMPGGEAAAFYRGNDLDAEDSGQGGVQVRYRVADYDLGLYAIRYHDKTPQLYGRLSVVDTPGGPLVLDPSNFNPAIGKIGEYFLVYPENIEAYGMSATTTFGFVNLAAEASIRRNTPLVSDLQVFAAGTNADNDKNPLYAVGNSFHAQLSWLASMEPSFIAQEADFLGEIAYNTRTEITKNPQALDPNTSTDAYGIRMVYEPKYRQVFSGFDISVPVGISYFPKGSSSVVASFGPDQGGDMNIGIKVTFWDVWRASLTYTHFYGSTDTLLDLNNHFTFDQTYADRDFIAFSIYRTF